MEPYFRGKLIDSLVLIMVLNAALSVHTTLILIGELVKTESLNGVLMEDVD